VLALVLGDDPPHVSRDEPRPVRRPGEALIQMRKSGVCDTDLQLARGYMGFRGVPGHEFVGSVLEADDPSWIGKRVVADINAGCGTCVECKSRGTHHCSARSVLGIVGRSGAFAELLTMPERCLVFAEPLAAALHVLDEMDRDAGRRAIVLGDGKLGQLIARALVGGGIETALIGRHAHKLAIAAAAGVQTFREGELPAAWRGVPVVVEATGSEAGLATALELVAPRGTVVLKTTVAARFSIDLAPLVIHEVRLVGSRCGDMNRAIDMLARGSVDPLPLVEARYPLEQAATALAHAARRGTMKIIVEGAK